MIALPKGTRVRGAGNGRINWLGTVQDSDVGRGHELYHVRWDGPGADDEWMERIYLSTLDVPAETPAAPAAPAAPAPPVRQPDPLPERPDLPHVTDLVIERLLQRKAVGLREYGTPLQPRNGRDPLVDLLDELLDGVQYLEQVIWERDHPAAPEKPLELHLPDYEPIVSPTTGRWFVATCSCGWKESGMRATIRIAQQSARDHSIEELRAALQSRGRVV